MCGRYPQHTKPKRLAEIFHAKLSHGVDQISPRYNIAPTAAAPVIRNADTGRVIELMRWGLVPHWSREPKTTYATFNARSEDAASKPTYRGPMRYRRCLIPVDGFYEWSKVQETPASASQTENQSADQPANQSADQPADLLSNLSADKPATRRTSKIIKQPWLIRMADEAPFALAGLYDCWHDELQTFTILTTQANEMMTRLHHRMPVIVDKENHNRWLDHTITDPQQVADICRPYPSELMFAVPVSAYVNNARNDGPECMEEVA